MPAAALDLIPFLIERVPGAGTTQIAELLYLADLEARKHLGRPISDLEYIWHDGGPFDSRIVSVLEQLSQQERIGAEVNGATGQRYFPKNGIAACPCGEADLAILSHVVETFGGVDRTGHVRQTRPILDARENNAINSRLRMELVDNEKRIPGLEPERMLTAARDLDAGRKKPYKQFFADQRAVATHEE